MDTKKFKIKSNGNKPKGGRNNTQTILTAAGVVSAGSAGLGYAVGRMENDPAQVAVEEPPTQSQTTNQIDQTEQEQQNSQTTNPETTSNTSGQDMTEPQPTDSSQQQIAQNQQQPVVDNDVNPDEIAQQIAQANEIDNNDIDTDDVLTVDGMTTAYGPDGTEMLVAVVHTPDGGQYLLADTDGDGIFSDVFDMEGNYVAEAEGNLTASDLEEMADDTGGYIAQIDGEPVGDDPTNDIIDTQNDILDDSVDIADNDSINDEEDISDEELLAQLLNEDDDDSDDLLAERLIDDEEEEEEDDSSDDDLDINDDIDSDEV